MLEMLVANKSIFPAANPEEIICCFLYASLMIMAEPSKPHQLSIDLIPYSTLSYVKSCY